jgi:prepilin-type N-terminal cleavage/methylation domain-containing protein
MNKTNSGFTLIELLVVIAIIAILIAFSAANFAGTRTRAKDVKVKAELTGMKKALRMYYGDYNIYPESPSGNASNSFNGCGDVGPGGYPVDPCTESFNVAGDVYMKLLPQDSEYVWYYTQTLSGDDFCMHAELANQSDAEIARSQTRCSAACAGVTLGASDYVVCSD